MTNRGPFDKERLTSVGPFTYNDSEPPELPTGFEPPSDVTNALGDFRWWNNWKDIDITENGATVVYDPEKDRVIIENRLNGPQGDKYLHDDMVVDIIEKGPFPKFPDRVVPAEGGVIKVGDELKGSVEIPTPAGGAFVTTERLPKDKAILEDGDEVEVEWAYKIIYALKLVDFPKESTLQLKHKLGRRVGEEFEAERTIKLSDAYRELQFEGKLPEPKVETPNLS